MYPEQKEPYKVFRAGDRSFPVYLEYDEQLQESYPAYPDFEECPEYTGEGRPFATAEQDNCLHCKPRAPRSQPPVTAAAAAGFTGRKRSMIQSVSVCAMREGVKTN